METMKSIHNAKEITVGFHPDGYRIDKTVSPMNRYTRWKITQEGIWENPTPVCFDSLPAEGWIKADRFEWHEQGTSKE